MSSDIDSESSNLDISTEIPHDSIYSSRSSFGNNSRAVTSSNCCFCLCLRKLVAGKKRRYVGENYTLDLSYITDKIIAMGFPALNYEAIYRNSYDHVKLFLDEHHPNHYKIYNLCQESSRQYDSILFEDRVSCYPIPDHNVPSLELLLHCCIDIDEWLKKDVLNIIAVHCKAGKGRTGLIICCYLIFSGYCISSEKSLDLFDEKRTQNKRGVTIPSQKRFTKYFENLYYKWKNHELPMHTFPKEKIIKVDYIIIESESKAFVLPCSTCAITNKDQTIKFSLLDDEYVSKEYSINKSRQKFIIKFPEMYISGEFNIGFFQDSKKSVFHVWLHSYYIKDNTEVFPKNEVDKLHKSKSKKIPKDFMMTIRFSDL